MSQTTTFLPSFNGVQLAEIDLRFEMERDKSLTLSVKNSWGGPWVMCPPYWRQEALRHIETNCKSQMAEEFSEAMRGFWSHDRELARAE